MGLYKRDLTWWMRFSHNGELVRRSCQTTDKKVAEKIYHKVMTQVAERRWIDRPLGEDVTVRELLDKYLNEYSLRNKALMSSASDKCVIKSLNRTFGDLSLTAVTPKLISEYKSRRREAGRAPKTVNNELTLLSHAFNLAMKEWELVSVNPVLRVSREKVNNLVERWLTYAEEASLLAVSPEWLQELIVFAIYTGLRKGEIIRLKWSQIDFSRRTLTILEQKNGGKDTLPLNQKALDVLKVKSAIRQINGYVFNNHVGNPLDPRNLLRGFYDAKKRAGLDGLRFHDLRHTSRLAQAGVDLYNVQKLMRHKTPIMTQRYAHH